MLDFKNQLIEQAFSDAGITTHEQYKKHPFLIFGRLKIIIDSVESCKRKILNVKPGDYYSSDRLIIIGERGIGKTSCLFFIKDLLEDAGVKTIIFSRVFEDSEHFRTIVGDSLNNIIKNQQIVILIDFPDTVETKSFKKFLLFLWDMLTHEKWQNMNFIFAMNRSHYDKSFALSEIFGKFMALRIERLSRDDTETLIESRLERFNTPLKQVFTDEIIDLIFSYSKGIPRNIVSACKLLTDSFEKTPTISQAEELFNEKYVEQVINDRVDNFETRKECLEIIYILKNNFKGNANSKEDLIRKVSEESGLGKTAILSRINELLKIGVITQQRGGFKRSNKIISIG